MDGRHALLAIERMRLALYRRIWNAIAPATITAVDDSGTVMRLQLKIGYAETIDGVPAPQQFGFASVPPIGADATIVFIAGDRSSGTATATNHQSYRPAGKASGESAMFNAFDMKIYLSKDGIAIDGGGKAIVISNAPTLTQNGDFHATGSIIGHHGTASQVGLETHRHAQGSDSNGDSEVATDPPTPGT